MLGIILAGGTGSRLNPLTKVTNKHLLPVGKFPMIYHPINTLREAGVKDILIVSGGENIGDFMKLLGSGSELGVKLTYRVQDEAGGIAQALSLANGFVRENDKFLVILGDNIMENCIKTEVQDFEKGDFGAKIFLKEVPDPHRFGIAEVKGDKVVRCFEKPKNPVSNLAILGVYMLDHYAMRIIPNLKPSARGELEITDVLNAYIEQDDLTYSKLQGFWVDAGTFESLHAANSFAAVKHKVVK